MISKRYTYAFTEFVHGNYSMHDKNKQAKKELMALFDKMTAEEKLDILSLNFDQLWFRVWLNNRSNSNIYYNAKTKFESTFLVDGGVKLKKMLSKSKNATKIWEIPKGRKKGRAEADINCAIREMTEETNISKKAYYILPDVKKTYSHIDDNVQYIITYYIGIIRHDFEPTFDFSSQIQISEISEARWMDINAIRTIDPTGNLIKFIRSIFKVAKKRNKA